MDALENKRDFVCDMDGVIYHGSRLLEGTKGFVDGLKRQGKRYLFLTNNSSRSPRELHQRLSHLGIEVGEDHFITSAMATAGTRILPPASIPPSSSAASSAKRTSPSTPTSPATSSRMSARSPDG